MNSRRWVIFAVVAVGFFVVALNGDIYNITSPPEWSWHTLLRKSYSIVAFALVGGTFVWASGASPWKAAMVVGIYSGAIEVSQHFTYGHEPFVWNVIDVFCGIIGGALGALSPWVRAK